MNTHDPHALRAAFGTFMTGVTVVTTQGPNGVPLGFTANSFTSVSLDPALLLVCLAKSSRSYDVFAKTEAFAINILAQDQTEVSNTFARPVEDRFGQVDWRAGKLGSPLLEGVSAWFDCTTHQIVDAGDHIILIGQVAAFDATSAPGLGYANGAYVTPSAAVEAIEPGANLIVSALIEKEGKVLLMQDDTGRLDLPSCAVDQAGTSAALRDLIASTGVQAQPGFVYSVFEDLAAQQHHIVFLCHAGDGTPILGAFTVLDDTTLADIGDPAKATLLGRFRSESRIGAFGIYYGDQKSGEVRHISQGK